MRTLKLLERQERTAQIFRQGELTAGFCRTQLARQAVPGISGVRPRHQAILLANEFDAHRQCTAPPEGDRPLTAKTGVRVP